MRKLKTTELNRLSIEEFQRANKHPIIVVLDNIRSMNNIGSVFRTCDAFRIEKLFLCGITATPPHREIQKTALDATESVKWQYFENTVDAVNHLIKSGYLIYAVEQTNKSLLLNTIEPKIEKKTALIFGNEINGIDNDVINLCDASIEIPQFGTKHSLNISVSVGIVLWHFISKIKRKV